MKYLYTRVSTHNQNLSSQLDIMRSVYAFDAEFSDKASGKSLSRIGFEEMNAQLQEGDVVYIYDLSRLGRNTADMLNLMDDWNSRGVGLVVHDLGGQSVDTSTASGKLLFTMFAAVAEMQRKVQAEKAALGMAEAVKAGKMLGGRPHKTKQIEAALIDVDSGMSKDKAARANGIGVATLYRALRARGAA